MSTTQFVVNSALLLTAMAIIAVLETALPFRKKDVPRPPAHAVTNVGFTFLTLAVNFLLNAIAIGIAAWIGHADWSIAAKLGLPFIVLLVASVLILDFFSYVGHLLMHLVPWLWRAHRMHHCDPFVDVTTAYRQHPIESLIRFVFAMVPAWLLGLPPEAIAAYRLLSASNALLEHMNIKLWQPLDSFLSALVVTPNMHKMHHSRIQHETDSNYGNIFSIYDRLFRTFTPTDRVSTVTYGLDRHNYSGVQKFLPLLVLPFKDPPPEPKISGTASR